MLPPLDLGALTTRLVARFLLSAFALDPLLLAGRLLLRILVPALAFEPLLLARLFLLAALRVDPLLLLRDAVSVALVSLLVSGFLLGAFRRESRELGLLFPLLVLPPRDLTIPVCVFLIPVVRLLLTNRCLGPFAFFPFADGILLLPAFGEGPIALGLLSICALAVAAIVRFLLPAIGLSPRLLLTIPVAAIIRFPLPAIRVDPRLTLACIIPIPRDLNALAEPMPALTVAATRRPRHRSVASATVRALSGFLPVTRTLIGDDLP